MGQEREVGHPSHPLLATPPSSAHSLFAFYASWRGGLRGLRGFASGTANKKILVPAQEARPTVLLPLPFLGHSRPVARGSRTVGRASWAGTNIFLFAVP